MTVKASHYEELLADYSNQQGAIALFKKYRPYLEMIPSMRRPKDSVISLPLPVVRTRSAVAPSHGSEYEITPGSVIRLPCDVAILMCDPEWKIKTGVEIFIFIHRPQEDFSDLLGRWRQTQIWLDKEYEWLMPHRYQHILSEGAEQTYPLFVLFPDTPERICRGLKGAYLPFVVESVHSPEDELDTDVANSDRPSSPSVSSEINSETIGE
jgi:hypothetical protein